MLKNCAVFLFRMIVLAATIAAVGCSQSPNPGEEPPFRHDVVGDNTPWTHEKFDSSNDKFTFAIFSDLTGGERERIFEIAVAQLSLLRPEFIINVGDLIEGDSASAEGIGAEWSSFDDRANRASAPVFYVGGNHDLTGEFLQTVWDERYGRQYYHFVYRNVLFMVLSTEDNTPKRMQEIFETRNAAIKVVDEQGWDAFGQTEYARMPEQAFGNISAEQSRYFVDVLAKNRDVRWTFLFVHKPAWEREDEQNFAAIEQAMNDRPYTVFNGHLHTYKYRERRGRDYIQLATTGGVQFPKSGRSADHFLLVTVDDNRVDIANLLMNGVLDKTGHIPLGGDDVCFESAECASLQESAD